MDRAFQTARFEGFSIVSIGSTRRARGKWAEVASVFPSANRSAKHTAERLKPKVTLVPAALSGSPCQPPQCHAESKGNTMKTLLHFALAYLSAVTTVMVLKPALALTGVKTWNFDKETVQELPSGWLSEHTGQGAKGNWKVVADPSAPSSPNVLAQLSDDATNYRFPLAVVERASYKDVTLSVRFKAISGTRDQGAGLVWRFRDANNYYIVRANALENNVVLYKVQDGKRISLAPKGTPEKTYGVKTKVAGNTWHKLGVQVKGSLFTVLFNDQKLFEVEDTTFSEGGKIGLWTKADSVIHFDDFTAEAQ